MFILFQNNFRTKIKIFTVKEQENLGKCEYLTKTNENFIELNKEVLIIKY